MIASIQGRLLSPARPSSCVRWSRIAIAEFWSAIRSDRILATVTEDWPGPNAILKREFGGPEPFDWQPWKDTQVS